MKSSLKEKLKALLPNVPQNEEELRTVAADGALASYELDRLTAERDEAVEEAARPFSGPILQAKKRLEAATASLKAWATGHRSAFGGKKSHLVAGHSLTFHQSPGKLVNPKKDDEIVDAIVAADDDALFEICIAVKPTLDKVSIKAALQGDDAVLANKLTALGFRVAKDESFTFIPASIEA